MHILITGSSGEIGTNLALKLQKMGHRVTGVDKRLNTWTNRFPYILQDLSVKYNNFSGGIGYTNYPNDIDLVVHLAANAKVHELVDHPSRAMDNITITYNVLEFCRQNKLPIIFSSSREVYADIRRYITDENQSNFRFTESPYSASKISGEALIYSYAKCYGVPYIVFRFSNVYGRYDCDIERMERVMPLFIKKIYNDEPINVFGRDKTLDFTYVDDCVAGIVSGIEKLASGEVKNETINLAYGEGNTLIKMAEYIGEALGKAPMMNVEDSKVGEVTHYVADISKARQLLNYNPQTPLKEGIKKAVAWWLEEGKQQLASGATIAKKKVVIFSAFYEPFMSGAERFVKEVIDRLADKYEITIITAKLRPDLKKEEDFGKYKVIRVGIGDTFDKIRYAWLAPLAAKKINPDLVHAVMESYAGVALWAARKILPGKPRILTLQSGDLDAKLWSKTPILWKGIHQSPDHITAISGFLANRAKSLGAANISIIPNGVDLSEIKDILVNKQNSENRHKIVCLARLSWEKDHQSLVAAMPKILEKYPDAEMIFIGDGPLRENIKSQILDLKLENKIKLLGNLPHKTALEELAKASVSICPSLAEGLGITFIEAQILGVPVIGTRIGGIPDVITDGETGFLIEPNSSEAIANSILKIFSLSDEERNKIIERAKIVAAEKFDWNKIAAKVDELYNFILASKPPHSEKNIKKNQQKKILICTGIYPPDIGGPATYTKLISEELISRGHKIRILTYGSKNLKKPKHLYQNAKYLFIVENKAPGFFLNLTFFSPKLRIFFHNLIFGSAFFKFWRYFSYFWGVLQLGKNADIIYVQDPVSVGLPATLANLFLKKKLILKIVGDYAWEQAQQVPNLKYGIPILDNFYPFKKENYPRKINWMQIIQIRVARRANKIITPSYYLEKILTRGWGIDEKKIKVIYNSFDIPQSTQNKNERKESDPMDILSIGRIVPWKGFIAISEVVSEMGNVQLYIGGQGPYREELSKIIRAFPEQHSFLLGGVSHDEVVQKMCSSDLFILNSGYEGLSHVILEAMAVGLPVAASCVGGNVELVGENEERGYLFEYNNKEQIKQRIEHIKLHPEEARERAKKARDFVADFSKEKMISRLEEELN